MGELPDVRNVVVLSYVYSTHRPYYERKATLYDSHLPKSTKQNLGFFKILIKKKKLGFLFLEVEEERSMKDSGNIS